MQEPKRQGFHPWVRKILWRRAWQPTPVFLPGKKNLVGYSPWGRRVRELKKLGVRITLIIKWEWVLVTQLCLTLWDPVDCSPPGSSVPGILQARTWLQFFFSLVIKTFKIYSPSNFQICWTILLTLVTIPLTIKMGRGRGGGRGDVGRRWGRKKVGEEKRGTDKMIWFPRVSQAGSSTGLLSSIIQ